MSIYREEAIQTLIESLPKKDFPNSQLAALDALSSLSGHLSASGKSLTEAWLLKLAGFDQPYEDSVKKENLKVNENEPIENMVCSFFFFILQLQNPFDKKKKNSCFYFRTRKRR